MVDVVCGVIKNGDKYLITQRGDKKNYGKWEFPGGKVKNRENLNDSIIRELKEELGVDIKPHKVIFQNRYNGFNLIFISCSYYQGDITLTEHLDYKWVKQNELKNFVFLEGDKDFIKQFEK